ncbi:MAG: VanW family protein [Solirubrobacterales bacterium]
MRKKRVNNKKYRMNRNGLIALIIIFIVAITGFFTFEYNTVKKWDNLIYPGVKVGNLDLSGKTKEEAKAILTKNQGNDILNKKINIKAENKTYTLEYSKLNPVYKYDDTINEVFAYGKNLSLIGKYSTITLKKEKNFDLIFSYDKKPVNDLLAVIDKETTRNPVDATIKVNSGFSVTPEQNGVKLQLKELQDKLFSEINGKTGSDTNVEAAVDTVKASVTSDMLSSINARISTFSTDYGSISAAARANNIATATRSVNGKVLMPGETFSFNGIVGERTAARGYQEAPVIIGNKVDSGLGGGICQVSTTLYNAVLKANLKIAERSHHTLPSHYVPLGMDATVDWGNLDFKFTNSYSYPLYIQGSTGGGYVTFSIYSNSALASTTCTVTNNVYETIPATTTTVDDPTLSEGQTVVEQPAYTGYKVTVYRNIYTNGAFVNQETVSNDYYKPVNGIIKKGTKKPDQTTTTTTPTKKP